jgi:hypothetical protein
MISGLKKELPHITSLKTNGEKENFNGWRGWRLIEKPLKNEYLLDLMLGYVTYGGRKCVLIVVT